MARNKKEPSTNRAKVASEDAWFLDPGDPNVTRPIDAALEADGKAREAGRAPRRNGRSAGADSLLNAAANMAAGNPDNPVSSADTSGRPGQPIAPEITPIDAIPGFEKAGRAGQPGIVSPEERAAAERRAGERTQDPRTGLVDQSTVSESPMTGLPAGTAGSTMTKKQANKWLKNRRNQANRAIRREAGEVFTEGPNAGQPIPERELLSKSDKLVLADMRAAENNRVLKERRTKETRSAKEEKRTAELAEAAGMSVEDYTAELATKRAESERAADAAAYRGPKNPDLLPKGLGTGEEPASVTREADTRVEQNTRGGVIPGEYLRTVANEGENAPNIDYFAQLPRNQRPGANVPAVQEIISQGASTPQGTSRREITPLDAQLPGSEREMFLVSRHYGAHPEHIRSFVRSGVKSGMFSNEAHGISALFSAVTNQTRHPETGLTAFESLKQSIQKHSEAAALADTQANKNRAAKSRVNRKHNEAVKQWHEINNNIIAAGGEGNPEPMPVHPDVLEARSKDAERETTGPATTTRVVGGQAVTVPIGQVVQKPAAGFPQSPATTPLAERIERTTGVRTPEGGSVFDEHSGSAAASADVFSLGNEGVASKESRVATDSGEPTAAAARGRSTKAASTVVDPISEDRLRTNSEGESIVKPRDQKFERVTERAVVTAPARAPKRAKPRPSAKPAKDGE